MQIPKINHSSSQSLSKSSGTSSQSSLPPSQSSPSFQLSLLQSSPYPFQYSSESLSPSSLASSASPSYYYYSQSSSASLDWTSYQSYQSYRLSPSSMSSNYQPSYIRTPSAASRICFLKSLLIFLSSYPFSNDLKITFISPWAFDLSLIFLNPSSIPQSSFSDYLSTFPLPQIPPIELQKPPNPPKIPPHSCMHSYIHFDMILPSRPPPQSLEHIASRSLMKLRSNLPPKSPPKRFLKMPPNRSNPPPPSLLPPKSPPNRLPKVLKIPSKSPPPPPPPPPPQPPPPPPPPPPLKMASKIPLNPPLDFLFSLLPFILKIEPLFLLDVFFFFQFISTDKSLSSGVIFFFVEVFFVFIFFFVLAFCCGITQPACTSSNEF